MPKRLPVLLLLLPILAGCLAGNRRDEVPGPLALATSTYEDVVRWGDMRKMVMFAKPGEQWPAQPNEGNVRVTGYDASPPKQIAPGVWGSTAVIDYVLVDRQVVHSLVDVQRWASDDEGKTWYRANPPPLF